MAPVGPLEARHKDFFNLLEQTIFTNPFSNEGMEIHSLISHHGDPPSQLGQRFSSLLPVLEEHFLELDSKGYGNIQLYEGEDRILFEHAVLFKNYISYTGDIDEVIQQQLTVGSESVNVPFAEKLTMELLNRGFNHQEACHYLSLFYQFRRAYYFIEEAMVGACASMKKLRLALWNNVFTHDVRIYNEYFLTRMEDFSTLLLGETGSGKGNAAAAIGRSGYIPFDDKKKCFKVSFTDIFTDINLSQYSESLIESELFGHRKGAFTGAIENHKGLFERCSPYGALFLDEIGDVSIPAQIKLLKVLQERIFHPVGSHEQMRFAGRVIAATNRAISDLRQAGNFRDDFFYRLSSDVIIVPSLRQRIAESPEELDLLVNLLIRRMTGKADDELSHIVLQRLRSDLPSNYQWPGNVRELEQAIRRIVLSQHYYGDLAQERNKPREIDFMCGADLTAKELVGSYCKALFERYGTYERVSKITGLDPRTAKKYLDTVDD